MKQANNIVLFFFPPLLPPPPTLPHSDFSYSFTHSYTHTHTHTHTHTLSHILSLTHTHAPLEGDGKVYMWDMGTRDCVHCFTDEGCLLGTKLSVSPSGSHLACGSDSGVVNVYSGEQCLRRDIESQLTSNPRPLKPVMNLTTAIDQVCFNSTR